MQINNIIHKKQPFPWNNDTIVFSPKNKLIVKNPYRFPSLSWYTKFYMEADEWNISFMYWNGIILGL